MAVFDIFKRRRPEDDFAQRIMARLAQRGWPHRMVYDPKRFEIRLGGDGGTMGLANTYREWLAFPLEERDGALDGAVAHVLEEKTDLSFEQAQDLLLPLVRNRCDMDFASRDNRPGLQPISMPVAGPLSIYLAIDRPHSISILNCDTADRWGLPIEALGPRALENLEARSPCRFEREKGGFFVSRFEDFYDCSRLLIPRLFDQLELSGDPVAVAVSRSCLVVAGSRETDHLLAMSEFVDQAMVSDSRPIAYTPLVWRSGAWSVFEPPEQDLAALRSLSVKQRLWDYSKQYEILNAESSGREVFIAKAEGQFDGQELRSWSTWTKGVPTLLPRTDYIGLTDLKFYIFRRWEDVERICGPFQAEPGHRPDRYFIDAWPDASALERLKSDFRPPAWGPD